MVGHDSLDSSWVDLSGETIGTKDRCHSRGSGVEVEEESGILGSGNQVAPAIPLSSGATCNDDLSLEDAILANTDPDIKSLLITKDAQMLPSISRIQVLIDILNDAMNENNFKKLDEVVENIKSYEDLFVADLDVERFKIFCIDHLGLKLEDQMVGSFEERQSRGDHSRIFSNILSRRCDIEKNNYNYSAKELLLLAIAASDKLTDIYQDLLFNKKKLSLLPLLVGGEKYISAFIERFPDLYIKLKDQVVQLNELNKIGFFSIIALRKEQNLLNSVLVEDVLGDLKAVLQEGSPDSFGVLETASLIQNEEFIKKVLDVLEKDAKKNPNDPAIRDLLKESFVTLLETAASQEYDSIVEYLCKKCLECSDRTLRKIYQGVFEDNKIVEQIEKELLKNIDSAGNERKKKRQNILTLVKSTASGLASLGISKEDLLRAAEFANISYYPGDVNHNNNNFAKLEERGYKTLAQFKKEGYTAIQFFLDEPVRQAGYVFIKDDDITITYRGTDGVFDIQKDLEAKLKPVEFLPENCNLHSGFYDMFKGSWESLYEILRGYANDRNVGIEELKITVTGHSMGGAVANIAGLYLKREEEVKNLRVVTIAAPRAVNEAAAELYDNLLWNDTVRVDNLSDPITMVPFGCTGYKHVGRLLRVGLGDLNGHAIENIL